LANRLATNAYKPVDPAAPRSTYQWEEITMRFMMIVRATKDSEAGKMPSEKLIGDMTKYNEEQEGEIEIRQLFELEDFDVSKETLDRARAVEGDIARKTANGGRQL
jgi:hypothetical protein